MALTIALLRAVNVGGRKLMMAELRQLMAELGFEGARTLLQSGNLVLDAGGLAGAELEARLEAATRARFGLATDYLVRTPAEWTSIVAANPFGDFARADPAHLLVMLLKAEPGPEAVAALRAAIVGREELAAVGRELFITYPDRIFQSKLTGALIERRLGLRGTARNWNTVGKLAELAST